MYSKATFAVTTARIGRYNAPMSIASTTSVDSTNEPDRLRVDEEKGIHRMTFPRGTVDGVAVREMYEATAALMDHRNLKLLVDFTGVQMLSSGVMGMLVTIRKKLMHTGGQLHIAVPSERAMESFHVMNLHLLLTLFPTPEEACGKFKC